MPTARQRLLIKRHALEFRNEVPTISWRLTRQRPLCSTYGLLLVMSSRSSIQAVEDIMPVNLQLASEEHKTARHTFTWRLIHGQEPSPAHESHRREPTHQANPRHRAPGSDRLAAGRRRRRGHHPPCLPTCRGGPLNHLPALARPAHSAPGRHRSNHGPPRPNHHHQQPPG